MENKILYEDNHLIAIVKRAGDISQGDKTRDTPLNEIICQYIKEKYNKPGNVFLGVIHRLDRPVSGVMVYAKTSKAAARIHKTMLDNKFKKTYWAVVKQVPPESAATLENYIIKNEKQNKSIIVNADTSGAKKAILHYRHIAGSDNYNLLEIELETGRHHQIRVQLANIGCPIKGDLKYGFSRSNTNGSIHLHAHALSFPHPVTKEIIVLKSFPENDPVWDAFSAMQKDK